MDLISLYQYGIKNVVATLGTALTEQQGILIKRYADTAIISYDSDEAGIKATLRAIDILTKLGINVKVLDLKDAKDPDEFCKKIRT
uniref:DNA primase n=1 Tax=Clostridioides difficile TaxID=1496 RepID=A0A381I9P8_CLODI|nr:DNA primase [Clostridioides difficile]